MGIFTCQKNGGQLFILVIIANSDSFPLTIPPLNFNLEKVVQHYHNAFMNIGILIQLI